MEGKYNQESYRAGIKPKELGAELKNLALIHLAMQIKLSL